MKKTTTTILILTVAVIGFGACVLYAQDSPETEESITLEKVPAEIMDVLKKVAPGFVASEVERETEGDEVSYSFEGKSGDYEIEIEIELDDDDDDDDDDDE